jgi:O-methyltransferase involved in polyketide biosynthesis
MRDCAAPGSRLLFTYVRRDFLDGTDLHDAPRLHHRMVGRYQVWRFGVHPEQVAPLLSEHGWTEREQVGGPDYRARYLEPAGRALPVTDLERFVLAERP